MYHYLQCCVSTFFPQCFSVLSRFSCVFCVAVGIDDPAALIMWEPTNLTNALTDINGAGVAFPVWLNGGVNPIPDIATLMQNILTHVATTAGGGGVVGNCLIAPNTVPQYANIKAQLTILGILPIFRAISPAHLPIGSNYIIADRTRNTTATADPIQDSTATLGSGSGILRK